MIDWKNLTKRETEVTALIGNYGLGDKQIAGVLNIETTTVKNIICGLYNKILGRERPVANHRVCLIAEYYGLPHK